MEHVISFSSASGNLDGSICNQLPSPHNAHFIGFTSKLGTVVKDALVSIKRLVVDLTLGSSSNFNVELLEVGWTCILAWGTSKRADVVSATVIGAEIAVCSHGVLAVWVCAHMLNTQGVCVLRKVEASLWVCTQMFLTESRPWDGLVYAALWVFASMFFTVDTAIICWLMALYPCWFTRNAHWSERFRANTAMYAVVGTFGSIGRKAATSIHRAMCATLFAHIPNCCELCATDSCGWCLSFAAVDSASITFG